MTAEGLGEINDDHFRKVTKWLSKMAGHRPNHSGIYHELHRGNKSERRI
jgi:hypothetical protein